jgi:EAL domain-containing protein (putative c-di-GMP-specific phosphodiesterase class I)
MKPIRYGCDEVQGYLYGKPMEAAAFELLMPPVD